jgi:uncharacterized membrane protein (DUF485 family)
MTRGSRPPAPISAARAAGQGFTDRRTALNSSQPPDFSAIQRSPEFVALRKRSRRFIFWLSAAFFLWYLAFAVLSAFDHAFMKRKVVGEINVGTIFGLLQFVSTIAIILVYQWFAKRKLDPQADALQQLAGVGTE